MLLKDKLKDRRLLLASHSPRRQQLLRDAGIDYELIDKYDVEELYPSDLPAEEVPSYLSRLKSDVYPLPLSPRDILLTADTVVILDGEVLGKPADERDAVRMLGRLSGRSHKVVTGVTLRTCAGSHTFSAESDVRFRLLTNEEIEYYVCEYCPLDKAGSYGIQEWIGYAAIEGISGSFYNVMGLPVQKVYIELNKLLDN